MSLALLAATLAGARPARAAAAAELPERYRQWLKEVELLIDDPERRAFLALEADYQRDAFIESFWKARDPDPETDRIGARDRWYERLDHASEEFGNWTEDRARVLLLNGVPALREELSCQFLVTPLEIWHYPWSERVGREVRLLFYERVGPPPRLWIPSEGYLALFYERAERLAQRCEDSILSRPSRGQRAARRHGLEIPRVMPEDDFRRGHGRGDLTFECAMILLAEFCGLERGPLVQETIAAMEREEETGGSAEILQARLQSRPDPEQPEWLATFAAHSTEVPAGAGALEGEVGVRFAGRHQSRTVVDVELRVPRDEATAAELGSHASYDFVLTGEVLRQDELFESFRYSFSIPEADAPETLPLIFRRHLRPGDYRLVLKLEDVHGGRFLSRREPLAVPREPPAGSAWDTGPDPGWALDALGALASDDADLTLQVQDAGAGVLVGSVRFEAAVRADEVDKLTFFLDGKPLLTRSRPPYTVELNLGEVPRPHTVRATAYGTDGRELAVDELELNAGENRFDVEIVEPRAGSAVTGWVPVRVEVETPEGAAVDRLELYRGETLVATLHQAPFVQRVPAPAGPGFLRAVAYLANGVAAEDTALLNVEGSVEEVNVELVEIYATVLDSGGRAVPGLAVGDFRVLEDGEPQTLVRFEPVSDRPVHLGIVVDASASMADHLPRVRQAATGFLESFLEPHDRAALVAFNDRPRLLERLTADVPALVEELAAFPAEGNTALWDSVVFALHHLGGIEGQRALLVLTDGRDETSRFEFEQALAYARAMGTTIYTIGIGTDMATRRHLATLAEESGGRSFRVESSAELDEVYRTIARELRAGYLLVYQSPRSDGDRSFRRVETTLTRPGYEVRAIRGYVP